MAEAMASEYGSPAAPASSDVVPPTMDPLELNSVLSSGSAAREEAAFAASVVDVNGSILQALDGLRSLPVPSDKFDEMAVSSQLDAILPPVSSVLPANADAIAALRDPTPPGPRGVLEKVRARVAILADAAANSPAKAPLFAKIAGYCDEAASILQGTRNKAAEILFCLAVSDLLDKIEEVPSAFVQPELLARAQNLDQSCGAFEDKRAVEDWTQDSEREEGHLYREVDAVLEASVGHQATNMETYATLTSFKVLPGLLSSEEAQALIARVEDQLAALREEAVAGERAGLLLQEGVDQYLANCRNSQVSAAETVEKLTAHITNLLADLGDAHLALWRETKRINVVAKTQGMITRKMRVNASLAEGEVEQANMLLEDARADVAMTDVTNETNGDVCADLADLAEARLSSVVEELYSMMRARLALIARKHFKLALSGFAVESSVEILKQEREGLLVKKQRANAAQLVANVAECSRAIADIDQRIASEEQRLDAVQDDRAQTREQWEFLFEALSDLALPEHYQDQLLEVQSTWKDDLARLLNMESDQLAMVDLADRLDATFLSASYGA